MSATPMSRKREKTRRSVRERLPTSVLEELWSIWQADPRVPSVRSRHLWATSRNANPGLVSQWFLRRKACAKKAGQPVLGDPYDIPLGYPTAPVQETSDFDAFSDLPSDDTLVYPPDVDCSNDLDTSSDAAFDQDMPLMESNRPEPLAYNKVPQQSQQESRSDATVSPSTIDPLASPGASKSCDNKDPFLICCQGLGEQSSFTCVLCSSELTQDMAQSDSHAPFDPGHDPFIPGLRLDFPSTRLSELSAIPFSFRTPSTVPPDSILRQNVNDWTIVEEELSRLVRDGELDFPFLDVPHLSSMELLDRT